MKLPQDINRGDPITARWLNAVKNAVISMIRVGPGLTLTASGGRVVIGLANKPRGIGGSRTIMQAFLITSSTKVVGERQWLYAGKRAKKLAPGHGNWSAIDGAIDEDLYNTAEDNNVGAGTYGNGISQANLDDVNFPDGTFDLQPIPNGTTVWCIRVNAGTSQQWQIVGMPNGVDGVCPS